MFTVATVHDVVASDCHPWRDTFGFGSSGPAIHGPGVWQNA